MALLWSSERLAAHEFPTPPYLVEPMIPQGGLAILHGKPGVGKTLLIAALAQAVNSGAPFLNRWPTRQGPVVVVQADMTGQIQRDRLLRIINDVNVKDTYWVVEEDGSTPYLDIQNMTFTQKELVSAIRSVNPVLVVWDTLRKIHRLDENSSDAPIAVFRAAREILGSASHLFIHHDRKESRDPDAAADTDEAFMGSQQWKGAVDATFSLREVKGACAPKRLVLTFHKARTAPVEELRPILLELDSKAILPLPVR